MRCTFFYLVGVLEIMEANAGESAKDPPAKKFGALGLIAIGYVFFFVDALNTSWL